MRWLIRYPPPIYTEYFPSLAGSRRTQVRATVLVTPSYERWGYFVSAVTPKLCTTPSAGRHQVIEQLPYRCGFIFEGHGPDKFVSHILADCYEYHSRSQLAHTKIGSIEKLPIGLVAKICQFILYEIAIVAKYGIQNAPDIFDHHSARHCFTNNPDRSGEEIAFILLAQLFTCFGKRRAWQSTAYEINTPVWTCVEGV